MAEIIYTETEKSRKILDEPNPPSQVDLDRKVSVFQDANKVAVSLSVLRSGINRPTGKRWFKWGTHRAFGFRRNTRGNVVPYQITRAASMRATDLWNNQSPTMAFGTLAGGVLSERAEEAFQKAMRETFSVRNLGDIYPLTRQFDIHKYAGIPSNLRPGFRYPDVRDAAVVLFGKSRITPEWSSAMLETDPYIIAVAQQFRGYAPNQLVLDFMKNNAFDDEMEQAFSPHTPRLRGLVIKMDSRSYEHILSNRLDNMDLKRIHAVCGEGINLDYVVGRLGRAEVIHNWTELMEKTTGRSF